MLSGCVLQSGRHIPVFDGASDKRPNFVIFFTDDQRKDTLGCYNPKSPIETPNLDRLANRGIRFDNGFVTTPICVVSRASLLTGRYESNSRVHQFLVEMPEDVFEQTYPIHLRKAGYFTGQLGKYGVGIREEQKKRFDVFEAQAGQGPAFRDYDGRKLHDAEWLTVKTEEFLNKVPNDKPFCLQINYKEPHASSVPAPEDDNRLASFKFKRSPYDIPTEYKKLPPYVQKGFGRVCYEQEFNKDGDHNPYLRQYHEKLMSVERSTGQIMDMLKQRGLSDNTVIIFLSDHGTHFGEKQLAGKWTPYEQSLRIPFIVYDPRPKAAKGIVSNEMVLNIDVAPTVLDLAGIPVPKVMDGQSIAPLINDEKTKWRTHFFYEHYTSPAPVKYIPRNVGVRTENTKYFRWIDLDLLAEEFYDLTIDPMETNNLINNPEYLEQIQAARKQYELWRRKNPSTYQYDSYGPRAQSGAKKIDWERFKKIRPKEYEKIKAEIDRLSVSWEQAVNDWEIRYEICSKAGYWY